MWLIIKLIRIKTFPISVHVTFLPVRNNSSLREFLVIFEENLITQSLSLYSGAI